MRHAPAAIVTDHGEALEAEVAHQLDLVLRHRALGIVDVLVAVFGLAAVAVAAQVRRDDGVLLCKLRRHAIPREVSERRAVDQQERWAAAADDRVQRCAACLDLVHLEAGQQLRIERAGIGGGSTRVRGARGAIRGQQRAGGEREACAQHLPPAGGGVVRVGNQRRTRRAHRSFSGCFADVVEDPLRILDGRGTKSPSGRSTVRWRTGKRCGGCSGKSQSGCSRRCWRARRNVVLPPQPPRSPLQDLAKQSGIQIIFSRRSVEGRKAPALNRHAFTPEAGTGPAARRHEPDVPRAE